MALPKLNTPKYELAIPSTGRSIEYRPYLVKEEKILMIALESEDEMQMTTAIKDIITSCTFDAIDVNRLSMFDVEYIFAKLRSKSVGETTNVNLPCEKCEHSHEVTINLDQDIQVSESGEKKVPLTDTMGIVMKYPSMSDYLDVQNSTSSDIDKVFKMIALSIESVYDGDEVFDGSSQSEKELLDFVESLNAEQFKNVQNFLSTMPQTFVKVNFTCDSCGCKNEFELKGLKNFFG